MEGRERDTSQGKESIISAISHVGDWEIGDRCQIGGRVGNIVYIGPTRFAPGEWIGIVLDQPVGKNDGSVDGHRYFSCEPNHGLFCKSSKLERVQSPCPSGETQQDNPFCKEYGMEIGDRVIVSGGKLGTLRFLGNTDFKEGVWAGIELDQPVGKNDGSVQGKRYFVCKAPYGLFAAASKVIRAPEQSPGKIKIRHTKTSALRQRSGSHESLSSIGASSVSSSRISKYNFATSRPIQRPIVISSARGQEDLFKALQDSLKEKETHLEQMIRERDIERNEMAALSNRCEEAEAKVAQLENAKTVADQQIEALKVKLDETKAKFKVADDTINDLTVQLKERKDALEDLTFRCDEETILNAELKEKIEELEKGTRVGEDENRESTKVLAEETAKTREELEILKKQCSVLEQERLAAYDVTKSILATYEQDFSELIQLVSPDSANGIRDDDEATAENSNPDSFRLLQINLQKLGSLAEYHKTAKRAVQEKLENNKSEMETLAVQLENLKKSVSDKADVASHRDEELKSCQMTVEQLRKQLEETEAEKLKLREANGALEAAKNALKENFDSLSKRNAEMIERLESDRKEHGTENAQLREDFQKVQNDFTQLQEQQKRAETEKSKLAESCESLEKSNKKLLADMELLESQKIEFENKLRQKESENDALSSSLAKNQEELSVTKSKADELTVQVDRLRANLCEASSSDESLKKEMETLREENKKEVAAHAAQAAKLQTDNESLEKELSAAKNSFQTLESTHSSLKSTLERNQIEFQELKEKFSSSQQELAAEHEKLAQLQQQIASGTEALEQLKKLKEEEASNHTTALSKLQAEKVDIQQRLHDLETEKETVLKEKDELTKEHAKVKDRYEALTQTLKGRVGLANDYEEKMKKLATKLQSIEKCLISVDCKGESLEGTIENLLAERTRLIDSERGTKKEVENLLAEKERHTSDLTTTAGKLSELEKERDSLTALLNSMKIELHKVTESLAAEQKDKSALIEEVTALKKAVANVDKSKDETLTALNDLAKEKSELEQHVARLEKEQNDKDAELSAVKAEMANAATESTNKDGVVISLQAEIEKEKMENDRLRTEVSKLTADFEALNLKNGSGSNIIPKENGAVDTEQNEQHRNEIEALKEEKDQAFNQISLLKMEILELSKKQADDEATVSEAKKRNALFLDFEEEWKKKEADYVQTIEELKNAVRKTETEKIEEMKQNISFLNTIIAEQVKKEQDLKNQIAVLNSIPANETLAELKHRTTSEVPTRLYCDICEEFDLHDTTDCPTQEMDMLEDAAHTHNNAKKEPPGERPYCEQCEEFGHDTNCCPKMQTQKSKSKDYTF